VSSQPTRRLIYDPPSVRHLFYHQISTLALYDASHDDLVAYHADHGVLVGEEMGQLVPRLRIHVFVEHSLPLH
jgi:hypothetical protein